MPAIDSLLKLIDAQRAQGLRLAPGQAPVLLVGEAEKPLSMPPLAPAMLGGLVEEILSDEERAELERTGRVELTYRTESSGALAARVSRDDESLAATFTKEQAAGAESAADRGPAEAQPPTPPTDAPPSPDAEPGSGGAARTPVPGATPSRLTELLLQALHREAADVFLSAGAPAALRIGDTLTKHPDVVVDDDGLLALLAPGLGEAQRQRLAERGNVDLAFELETGDARPARFRVALFRQANGLAAAFRPIARRIPALLELGLPTELTAIVGHHHGLVLMTGPTGSGKSTTLAALIEHLNQTASRHVITVEDPIEFTYAPKRCLIHQRELGTHVDSYAEGLRAALRSAPDVILLGEMRDPETIAAAITAAETGHLVLSTLHCGNAGMAVDRIVDGFPEARQNQVRLQLADVLRSVVSQRLVEGMQPGTRIPVCEILHVTHAVAALIREGRTHQIASAIQTGRDRGMISFERALADLVHAGRVGLSAAQRAAPDPAHFADLVGGVRLRNR